MEKEGLGTTIFSLCGIEHREVETHEMLLYYLLHEKGYVREFLQAMELPQDFCDSKNPWTVAREYCIEGGKRIDLFLYQRGNAKKAVVVELKINAGDQYDQMANYEAAVKDAYDYRIVYLTLDGKKPSAFSVQHVVDKDKVLQRSFFENCVAFLKKCLAIESKVNENSMIHQYISLINTLKVGSKMNDKISNAINSEDEFNAAREIHFMFLNKMDSIKKNYLKIYNELYKNKKRNTFSDENNICLKICNIDSKRNYDLYMP